MGKLEKLISLNKELLLAFIVALIGGAIRYFISSTQEYYMNIDSYAYLRNIKEGSGGFEFTSYIGNLLGIDIFTVLLYIITMLSIVLIYFTCRIYASRFSSFMSGTFFAFSPLVFFNNQFGIIDKNIPSIFMIILGIFIIAKFDGIKRMIILVPYILLFRFVWEGAFGMLMIIGLYYAIKGIIDKKLSIIITSIIISIIGFGLGYSKFKGLTNPTDWALISELNPIWNIGLFSEFLLIVIIWILVFTKIRLEKKNPELINKYLFMYLGFIFTFFAMVFIFRLNIFFMPFLYVWMAILLEDLEYPILYKSMFLFLIGAFIIGTSMNIYFRQPVMNDGLKDALYYVDNLERDCLIGVWSKGHIYNYYTNMNVLYSATASKYKEQLDYMVVGKETDCVIIWDSNDVLALKFMLSYDKKEMDIDSFYINRNINNAVNFKYKDNIYYVLEG